MVPTTSAEAGDGEEASQWGKDAAGDECEESTQRLQVIIGENE